LGFNENDKRPPNDLVSLELDPNEDNGSAEKFADIEKRLNALELQVAHMLSLLELLTQDLTDRKEGSEKNAGHNDQ
jgi:hypothetical protein